MNTIGTILVTICVGILGSVIAKKCSLPAYALLGALVFTAIFNIVTGMANLPVGLRPVVQVLAGIFIGSRVNREELVGLKGGLKPIIISLFSVIVYSLLFGLAMRQMTGVDLLTSILATAPGGIMDLTLVGMDMHADLAFVTSMQFVRLISVVSIFPVFINLFLKKTGRAPEVIRTAQTEKKYTKKEAAITLFVGFTFGSLGYVSGLPAMTLLGAMSGVALQNVLFGNAILHKKARISAQIAAGVLVGQTLTWSAVLALKVLLIPTLLMVIGYSIMTLVIGSILYKTTELDFATALFACTPGGATDIALMCEDFGANSVQVSMVQYPRVFVVVGLYPLMIQLLM